MLWMHGHARWTVAGVAGPSGRLSRPVLRLCMPAVYPT